MMLLILTLTFIVLIMYIYQSGKRRMLHLPPGPPGLPFLGNNHQLVQDAPLKLSAWAQQYGKMYTIYIGNGNPALVINDALLMKEIFSMETSTGHFRSELMDQLFQGPYGVVNSEGKVWSEQRRFCVRALREFGFGKSSQMETMILPEAEDLCNWINDEKKQNEVVYLAQVLKETTGNILWAMVTGERMKTNVSQLLEDWIMTVQKAATSGLAFFSWIKYIAPEWSGYNAYSKACKNIHEFVQNCFEEHKKSKENGNINEDMISAYLNHIKNTKEKDSSFYGEIGYKHSFYSVVTLLVAGGDTTSNALTWMIFYLCTHKEVQTKLQNEIDEVLGSSGNPLLTDRSRMPYTMAVIQETLRKSSVTPFGIMHRLMEDVSYKQYKFPKGLILLPNIFHVNNDVNIWGDPENFRPERFLGNQNLKDFVVTFQAGKRVCVGEPLTREIMFLFAVKLFQTFCISMDENREASEYLQPQIGYFLTAKNIGVRVERRNK